MCGRYDSFSVIITKSEGNGISVAEARNNSGRNAAKKKNINVKRLLISLIIAIAAIYYIYIMVWQQIAISKKSKDIEALERQLVEATAESERLSQEVENLNDPEYLERVAREQLGLVRPNERVFVDSNKSEDNGR